MHTILLLLACTPTTAVIDPADTVDPVDPVDTVDPADPVEPPPPALVVNEVLASNHGADLDGADWVELFNPTAADVALDGWTLSEDVDEPGGSALDGLVVPAEGYLVLAADDVAAPGHLGFSLDADGGQLALWFGDVAVDRLVFPAQIADASLARSPDGAARWLTTSRPTPGAAVIAAPADPDVADASPPSPGALAMPTHACRPVGAPVHAWEARAATVEARCATGERAQAVRFIAPFRWDDPPTDEGAWTPPLDAAGTWEVLVEIRPEGALVPDTAVVEVQVADAWNDRANVPVDPVLYTEEWGLPVLFLHPVAGVSQDYGPMEAVWDGETFQGQIKIRGAASASYPKSSYTLEFDPVSLPIPGFPDKDHLVLISDFDDNAHIRQRLVFETFEAMQRFEGAPRIAPHPWSLVVYVDGVYQGLYTAVDHVDDELIAEQGFDNTGDLFKSVSHDANFYLKDWLSAGWEKKEGDPPDDYRTMDALTRWSGTVNDNVFARDAASHLVVHDFMDWYLLVHHFAAGDSGGKNAYLYLDPPTGQWRYTPWDFNQALGQDWQTYRVGWDDNNDFTWTNGIFAHIQGHPALSAEQDLRYAQMRAPGGPLALDRLLAAFDHIVAESGDAAWRDWIRWEADYRAYWGFRNDILEYEGERDLVRDWIVDRDAFITTVHGPPTP
jgi:spore coat protein H